MAAYLDEVRMFVYRWFADRGEAPTVGEVAAGLGMVEPVALDALQVLHDDHLVVLDRARQRIVMAHPWSADPLGFVVASDRQKWWGGCAWDSFAIPALVERTCLVATHCPACGRPMVLDVRPDGPPAGEQVAHLPIPVRRMWDDVVLTCSSQLLFCSESHVDSWIAQTGQRRGAVLDLDTLWSLATGWYAGRLTREYRRRTPAEAAEFFTGLGLTGSFWHPGCTEPAVDNPAVGR